MIYRHHHIGPDVAAALSLHDVTRGVRQELTRLAQSCGPVSRSVDLRSAGTTASRRHADRRSDHAAQPQRSASEWAADLLASARHLSDINGHA
jgi:hypothetical protein